MKSRLARHGPSLLMVAALLSCVLLLYVPCLSFLPAWHGSPATPSPPVQSLPVQSLPVQSPLVQPAPVQTPDSTSPGSDAGGSLVENMLDNVEFHHKQADSSSKLDFNRLAQEGANMAAARGNIGPEGSLVGILELPVAGGVKTGNVTNRKHQFLTTPTNKKTSTTSSKNDHLVDSVPSGASGGSAQSRASGGSVPSGPNGGNVQSGARAETVASNVRVNVTFPSRVERSQRSSPRVISRFETSTLREIFRFIATSVVTPKVP